jgi:cold shock CspA family protein
VQATVQRWDAESGAAVLDDGTTVTWEGAVLVGLRQLHPGQRVQLVVEGGRVVRVGIVGDR